MRVGFGRSEVSFPDAVFPNPRERYTGVHDAPLIHAMLIEDSGRYCFVFMDLVDPGDWDGLRVGISERTGICGENILLILSHPLSTPHCMHPGECANGTELRADSLLRSAIHASVMESVTAAAAHMTDGKVGIGGTACAIHANRVTETAKGFDQAVNFEGETDTTVPVIVFRSTEDRLLAVIYTVNTSPAIMENAVLSDGSRLVSGDLASCTSRILEERFGIHAIYTTGASADQWPILRALETVLVDGELRTENRMETGYTYLEALSGRLADQVGRAACRIPAASPDGPVALRKTVLSMPAHRRISPAAARTAVRGFEWQADGEIELASWILTLGSTAVIGCQPEICVKTARELKAASPYRNTVIMEFVNGTADYMASAELYQQAAPQSRKGRFMPGAAERYVEAMRSMLAK